MNQRNLTLAAILVVTNALGADAPLPPELAAARTRYDSGIVAATKPVRDRYVSELQQMKSRAMAAKNLELAVAIDRELKAVAPSETPAGASRPLSEMLPGSKWLPIKGGRWKSIEFTTDGKVLRTHYEGKVLRAPYQIDKNGDVTCDVTTGDTKLRFSRGNRQLEHDGAVYKLAQDQ